MASYGKLRTTTILGQAGTTWYVQLWKKDYVGASSPINLGGEGFEVKWTGSGGTRDRAFLQSECILIVNILDATDEGLLYDIFEKGDREYYIRVYKGNSGQPSNLWWFGWVQPSFSKFENSPFPYSSQITATDSIGTFSKQIDSDLLESEFSYSPTINEHIKDFGDSSGIYNIFATSGETNAAPALDDINWFATSIDWWRNGDTYQSDDPFYLYKISKLPFRPDPEKFPTKYSKYNTLKESLRVFNTVGVLSNGQYNFIQANNYQGNTSGDLTFYDYSQGNEQDTTSVVKNNLLTIDGTTNTDKGVVMSGSTITYEPPFKSVSAKFKNGSANIILHPNTDYTSYGFVGNIQEDPTAPENAGLILNLHLRNFEDLSESLIQSALSSGQELKKHLFYTTFNWQIKLDDGTSTYYLTNSSTSDRYEWVAVEPTNVYHSGYAPPPNSDPNLPVSYNASPSSTTPCNMFLNPTNPGARFAITQTFITFVADLPPITGSVSVKLNAVNSYYTWEYNGTTNGLILPFLPAVSPFVGRDVFFYPISTIVDYDSSALSDDQEGIVYKASQNDISAEEGFEFSDIIIGASGVSEVQPENIQYNDSSGEVLSVSQGFRRGNSGSFINPTQLLCSEFLSLQKEPLEILQADVFSPDVSPLKLLKYSINDDSTYKYYSFLGGSFKAQSETMNGEWFKLNNYTSSTEEDVPIPPDGFSKSDVNEGHISQITHTQKVVLEENSLGLTSVIIASQVSITKVDLSSTSKGKVYDGQKLLLKSRSSNNYLVVVVDGTQNSGLTDIDIVSITPDFSIPIGSTLSVLTYDLTNVITAGTATPNLYKGVTETAIYIKAQDFNMWNKTGYNSYTRDDLGSVQPSGYATRTEVYASTYVPIGYKVTSVDVYSSQNRTLATFTSRTTSDLVISLDTGTANTTITLATPWTSVLGDYFIISYLIGASTDEIYGAKLTIIAVP